MANFRELFAQAKAAITETTAEEVHTRMEAGEKIPALDVREQDEVQNGVIPGARHLSRAHFESRVEDVVPDKDAEVVVTRYVTGGEKLAKPYFWPANTPKGVTVTRGVASSNDRTRASGWRTTGTIFTSGFCCVMA